MPTEAAALGAFFAGELFIIRRGFALGEMSDLPRRAIRTSCMIGIILLGAATTGAVSTIPVEGMIARRKTT